MLWNNANHTATFLLNHAREIAHIGCCDYLPCVWSKNKLGTPVFDAFSSSVIMTDLAKTYSGL